MDDDTIILLIIWLVFGGLGYLVGGIIGVLIGALLVGPFLWSMVVDHYDNKTHNWPKMSPQEASAYLNRISAQIDAQNNKNR